MSLIFHRFPSYARAGAFVDEIGRYWPSRDCTIFTSERDAFEHDIFPAALTPPIVHVDRDDDERAERTIELAAWNFGGRFAGT